MTIRPWTLSAVAIAGWMNRQQDAIIYLKTANQMLREELGQKRILLSDEQERRLATAAAKVCKSLLRQATDVFSPETFVKRYRELIASRYDAVRS